MDDLQNLLALAAVKNVGPSRLRKLIQIFGTPADVFKAKLSELVRVSGVSENTAREIKANRHQEEAAQELQNIKKHNVEVVTIWDENFPPLLKNIYDPPVILYYCGTLEQNDRYAIGIVGARRPTAYGLTTAETLAKELASRGITIVSGLAVGIDSSAHRGTLQGGGRTIAVLGSGLDRLYPPESKPLARKIVKQGAVVSEFPLGTKPEAGNFPRRNRIISGLSLGVVIIEAAQKSGALITAEFATEQGREVFVVPGNITSTKHVGSHQLIKQGAKLVQSVDDILEEITPHLLDIQTQKKSVPVQHPHIKFSKDEEKIMNTLSSEPVHIDKICLESGFPPQQTLAILLMLELNGVVKALEGKRYIKI